MLIIEKKQEAIDKAKTPGPMICPVCSEEFSSPIYKLSIVLFGRCRNHLSEMEQLKLEEVAKDL